MPIYTWIIRLLWLYILPCGLTIATETLQVKTLETGTGQRIHVVQFNPADYQVIAVQAQNRLGARATLTDMASEANALLGINGGFFHLGLDKNGFPAGILKIADTWYGVSYSPRAALAWNAQGKAKIDRVQTHTHLAIQGKTVPLHQVNPSFQPASSKGTVFTSAIGSKPIQIPPKQAACVFRENKVLRFIKANPKPQVLYLQDKEGVYLSRDNSNLQAICQSHATVTLSITVIPQMDQTTDWSTFSNIVGGTPLLMQAGRAVSQHRLEKFSRGFSHEPHGRTAICLQPSGDWIVVVAEQNLFRKNLGLTLDELTRVLKKLGCRDAINLDGGTSSSLYFKGQRVAGAFLERIIPNAILVLPKSGEANH